MRLGERKESVKILYYHETRQVEEKMEEDEETTENETQVGNLFKNKLSILRIALTGQYYQFYVQDHLFDVLS